MNRRTLLVLLVLASLAVALAVLLERGSAGRQQLGLGELLLPGLETRASDLQEVQILPSGGDEILLYRTAQDWAVAGYEGYPADLGTLSDLFDTLVDMELEEAKTANPEHHVQLGLNVPAAEEGGALQIRLLGAGQELIAALLFGDESASRNGQYVRRSDENQSWLADRRLPQIPLAAREWLQQPLLEIPYDRIREVHLTAADEEYRLYRALPAEQNLLLDDLPAERTLSAPDVLNEYGSALEDLRFADLLPAAEAEFPEVAAVSAKFICFDGLGITVQLVEEEQQPEQDAQYALLRLRFTLEEKLILQADTPEATVVQDAEGEPVAVQEESAAGAVPVIEAAVTQLAEDAPAAATALPDAAVTAEREQLEILHTPWVYRIDIDDFNRFLFDIDAVLAEDS